MSLTLTSVDVDWLTGDRTLIARDDDGRTWAVRLRADDALAWAAAITYGLDSSEQRRLPPPSWFAAVVDPPHPQIPLTDLRRASRLDRLFDAPDDPTQRRGWARRS